MRVVGDVAQSVEHLTWNQRSGGSSPPISTIDRSHSRFGLHSPMSESVASFVSHGFSISIFFYRSLEEAGRGRGTYFSKLNFTYFFEKLNPQIDF